MKGAFTAACAALIAAAPAFATDLRVAEAKQLAAKTLGDEARDLVFIPITPCTVWDTRFATDPGAQGPINAGTTKRFYSHLGGPGGSYAAWGGNPSCPETAQDSIGMRPYAVMMTIYINDASAQGWLTLYRDGDPDPSLATISVYYAPGPTRTQTVISKSSRGYGSGTYDIAATSRFGNVHASASVTGYFLKVTDAEMTDLTLSGNLHLPATAGGNGEVTVAGLRFMHTAGVRNVFIGQQTGNLAATGSSNFGAGYRSLAALTTGGGNVAVGNQPLDANTTGSNNVAIGSSALAGNLVGGNNIAIGASSLPNNNAFSNVAIGANSAFNTNAGNNVAVGTNALFNNSTGAANIAIGASAGGGLTGSNNIAIGHFGVASESGVIRIGDGVHAKFFAAGVRGITTGNANAIPVLVDSLGQLGTISSSAAVKDDIADMAQASSDLMKLRPVTFHYKQHGPEAPLQYGLIAEEVDKVYPGLVARRADGQAETVMYQYLPPMLLNEVQKQQRRIEAQDAEIAALRQEMARMARLLEKALPAGH